MLNCMCFVVGHRTLYCVTHLLHYTHQPRANLFLANSLPPVCCQPERVKNMLLQDTWSKLTASFLTNSGKCYLLSWAHRHLWLVSVTMTNREERACCPSHPANFALLDSRPWMVRYCRDLNSQCIKCSAKPSYNPPACTIRILHSHISRENKDASQARILSFIYDARRFFTRRVFVMGTSTMCSIRHTEKEIMIWLHAAIWICFP